MAAQPVAQLPRITGLDIQCFTAGEQTVRLNSISHGQVDPRQGCIAHLPAAQAPHTQRQHHHRRRSPAPLPTLAQLPTQLAKVQLRRTGQLAQPGQRCAQPPGIGAPAFHPCRSLRVGRQPGLHLGPAHRFQALIDVSVQFVIAGDQARHFSLRKAGGWGLPSVSSRKALRARDRRDITVPMGMPKAWAASL
ncbi:hypothetical protein D3C76_1011350 [compost metagenome]